MRLAPLAALVALPFAAAPAQAGITLDSYDFSFRGGATAAAFPGTNGKLVFTRGGISRDIYAMAADGSGQTPLKSGGADDRAPVWSPDGTKIAFESTSSGNGEIYVMNADGSNVTNATNTPGSGESWPAWSPDGTKIAFTTMHTGEEIYVMNADGTGRTRLTTNENMDNEPVWSPDGTKIAFVSARDVNTEVYVMNADGTNQVNLTSSPGEDSSPSWSPDGTKIAFDTTREGNDEVFQMTPTGADQVNLSSSPGQDQDPAWSPDGTRLALSTNRDGEYEIYSVAANGTDPKNLTNHPAQGDFEPDWQRIASSTPDPDPDPGDPDPDPGDPDPDPGDPEPDPTPPDPGDQPVQVVDSYTMPDFRPHPPKFTNRRKAKDQIEKSGLTYQLTLVGEGIKKSEKRLKQNNVEGSALKRVLDKIEHGDVTVQKPAPGTKLTSLNGALDEPITIYYYDAFADVRNPPKKCGPKRLVEYTDERGRKMTMPFKDLFVGLHPDEANRRLDREFNCRTGKDFVFKYKDDRKAQTSSVASTKVVRGRGRFQLRLTIRRPRVPDLLVETRERSPDEAKKQPGLVIYKEELSFDVLHRLTVSPANLTTITVVVTLPATGQRVQGANVQIFDPNGAPVGSAPTDGLGEVSLTFPVRKDGDFEIVATVKGRSGGKPQGKELEGWKAERAVDRHKDSFVTGNGRGFKWDAKKSKYVPDAKVARVERARAAFWGFGDASGFVEKALKAISFDNVTTGIVTLQNAIADTYTELRRQKASGPKIMRTLAQKFSLRLASLGMGAVDTLSKGKAAPAGYAYGLQVQPDGTLKRVLVPAVGIPLKGAGMPVASGTGFTATGALGVNGVGGTGVVDGRNAPILTIAGAHLIGTDGATLIGTDGATLISESGSTLIGTDGATLIGTDGATLISESGSTLIGTDGATYGAITPAGLVR